MKPQKIKGYILKFGEEIEPNTIISKNCKITFPKHPFIFKQNKLIGQVQHIEKDKNGLMVTGNIFDSWCNQPIVNVKTKWLKNIIIWFIKKFNIKHKTNWDLLKQNTEVGYGGIVREREGNLIKSFDLKEVSIIPKT